MPSLDRMPLFRALALVAGAFVLLVHAAYAQGTSPGAVIYGYEYALGQQDINGAVGQFADDAVVTLQDARTRSLRGPDQIREFLMGAGFQGAPVLTSNRHVDGSAVTWTERTERPGEVLSGSDLTVQAVVRDGKIQSIVYRPGTLVLAAGPGTEVTPESAATALLALLLLGLGLLSLATVRPHVRSGSRLRGRLIRNLRRARPAAAG
jgi:hypothetical protein